ncbi:MAG: glucosaminidase domain-containing protein [Sulfurimonas sp.]|nr:glucosaminidase domain-containing protein [Sulfurimonas sp.]MCK4973698.1 glucosaminidase domain-containing protein [Sulfurimonas sp.]
MKHLYMVILLSIGLFASEAKKNEIACVANIVPKNMSVAAKKKRFYTLLVPAIDKVYKELQEQFKNISKNLENGTNPQKIAKLKVIYKVKSDEELLLALKPHPKSIALAQAAMESSWATSRFFVEANNAFGIWSYNKNEPRIPAAEKRGGKHTIWLRKCSSIEESVRAYYKTVGRGHAYKEFRRVRSKTDDVFEIVKKLDKYSEIGDKYVKEVSNIIRYNKLTKYD